VSDRKAYLGELGLGLAFFCYHAETETPLWAVTPQPPPPLGPLGHSAVSFRLWRCSSCRERKDECTQLRERWASTGAQIKVEGTCELWIIVLRIEGAATRVPRETDKRFLWLLYVVRLACISSLAAADFSNQRWIRPEPCLDLFNWNAYKMGVARFRVDAESLSQTPLVIERVRLRVAIKVMDQNKTSTPSCRELSYPRAGLSAKATAPEAAATMNAYVGSRCE